MIYIEIYRNSRKCGIIGRLSRHERDFMNENISLPRIYEKRTRNQNSEGTSTAKRIFNFKTNFWYCSFVITASSVIDRLLVIAIAIKLEDGGPVFYRQERVTTNGRKFKIFKFRTMVLNADKVGPLCDTRSWPTNYKKLDVVFVIIVWMK